MATETSATGTILRRYVRADGDDEPLVWYEGAGTTDRRWHHSDERGSIVALSDNTGAMTAINKYDEYGIPGAGNIGRFQYTGQAWIAELGLYYYKARMYSPTLGKFMQTDPVEYEDGMNWYNYAGSDPINMLDPTGLGGIGTKKGSLPAGNSVTPKISQSAEETMVNAYWLFQKKAGNPIAGLGLQFGWDSEAFFEVAFARTALIIAIAHVPVNGRYPNLQQVRSTYQSIRVDLMLADQAARIADRRGVPGLLSPGQIYDYHARVYRRYGIRPSAFGGSYPTGSRQQSILTSIIWCRGCDNE